MMFPLAALLLTVLGLVHGRIVGGDRVRVLELGLVYLLAGYHGVVMLAVALFTLLGGPRAAAMAGAEPGSPFQQFAGFAFLGLSIAAILAVRLRDSYPVGPVVAWTVYFLGATGVHWREAAAAGDLDATWALRIVTSHALPALAMLALLLAWRRASSVSKVPA